MKANDEKSVKIEVMGPDGPSDSGIQALTKSIESKIDVKVSVEVRAAPKDAPKDAPSLLAVISTFAQVAGVAVTLALGMWHADYPDYEVEFIQKEDSEIVKHPVGIEYEKIRQSLDNSNTGMSVRVWRRQDP